MFTGSCSISIIGLGFVGGAMHNSFSSKYSAADNTSIIGYDKYRSSDTLEECLNTKIMFLCLPTLFNEVTNEYDKEPIIETCIFLEEHSYSGIVVIKSTVEPGTVDELVEKYPRLKFVHNPEFLTAATAIADFNNQSHIVLGKSNSANLFDSDMVYLSDFYAHTFPNANISICTSLESESMKIFLNCFYASKIQIFNEFYALCQKMGCDYNVIKTLMLGNNWINPMHTNVPGVDGQMSYGGMCFPKDTNALLTHMRRHNTPSEVLSAVVHERNTMREDNVNISTECYSPSHSIFSNNTSVSGGIDLMDKSSSDSITSPKQEKNKD